MSVFLRYSPGHVTIIKFEYMIGGINMPLAASTCHSILFVQNLLNKEDRDEVKDEGAGVQKLSWEGTN